MPRRFAAAVQVDSWRLCTLSGVHGPRVTCEPAPKLGPTGSTWAKEQSEPRHAEAEGPPTERSGARAGANEMRRGYFLGTKPEARRREVGGARTGQLIPGSEETGPSSLTERVQSSRQGSAECREDDRGRNHRKRHSSSTTEWSSGRASRSVCFFSRRNEAEQSGQWPRCSPSGLEPSGPPTGAARRPERPQPPSGFVQAELANATDVCRVAPTER